MSARLIIFSVRFSALTPIPPWSAIFRPSSAAKPASKSSLLKSASRRISSPASAAVRIPSASFTNSSAMPASNSSVLKPVAAAASSASTPLVSPPHRVLSALAPASSRVPILTSCRTKTARSPPRTPSPPALIIPPLVPSTLGSPISVAPNTPPSPTKQLSTPRASSPARKASFPRSNPPTPSQASSSARRKCAKTTSSSSIFPAAATRTWTLTPACSNLYLSQKFMSSAFTNSTRISKRFAELRRSGELGIVAYITAGDPSLDATLKFVLALAEAGADVIELGVPFSDPLADGPTIQRASERALKSGATLAGILELVRRIRQSSQVPLVLFSYYNPILQMGLEKFASAAASAGADGVLSTDLTPEESEEYRRILAAHHLDTIFLGAPTFTEEQIAKIAACSSGFLYLISCTGVTGAKDALPDDLPALLRRTRRLTQLPIAVGFGISLPGHVSVLGGLADAAVVGSALVSEIEKAKSVDGAADALAERVRSLKEAARHGLSRREAPIHRGGVAT